ncbi:MAG: PKD domain-containing protein [Flavitalea sp.]
MKKLTLALGLLMSLMVQGQQQVAKKIRAENGVNIGYYEFTPKGYNKNQSHPLIIFLHGVSERGNGGSDIGKVARVGIPKMIKKGHNMEFNYNGKKESFVVLSPQLGNNYGSWQPFYIEELIKYAKKNLGIDANRIYVTGLSLGGGGVWSYISKEANSREIAAALPVCGTCMLSNPSSVAKASLPVWAFHAKNDSRVTVNCTLSAIDRINLLNPNPKAKQTIWATGNHTIWDKVYNDKATYEWMLSQKRNGKPSNNNDDDDDDDNEKPDNGGNDNNPAPSTNKAPIADAGSDKVVYSNNAFVNGGNSYDPDGKIVKYEWKKVSGPSAYKFINDKYYKTKISGLSIGTYVFSLTVTDNKGATATSKVQVRRVR